MSDILLGNEYLVDEFVTEFKREAERLRKGRGIAERQLLKELQQVERGIKRCLEFILGGDGNPGSVRDQLQKLEDRKRDLDSELEASQHTSQVELHPNLADLYRRKVTKLRSILNDETTRAQAVDIVRSLIDHVEIIPGQKRGQCEVVVVGALAQFLAFAQQKTTAGSCGDDGTFLMVAGAGFAQERTKWTLKRYA